MRKAEIDHAWEECRQADRAQLRITALEVSHEDGSDELTITSRITGFIGPNGAGKTGVLNALYQTLEGRIDATARTQIPNVQGNFRGRDFVIHPHDVSPPAGFASEYLDASLEVHTIQRYINNQSHLEELLAQYEPNHADQAQLGLYRHVCGRHYAWVSVLEIEAPTIPEVVDSDEEEADEIVFPFFRVQVSGITYDNRSMGFGELCACYLVWKLHRTRKGTALLLDEPDSHLSPASRRALIDAMVLLAKERQLWIGFTTHSIELLETLRESEIFLVLSDVIDRVPRIAPSQFKRHTIRALGLAQPRRLLIAVEDVDAKAAVWYMINRWGNDIANCIDVQIVSGGAQEVIRFVAHFPADTRICQAVAILDGDKRAMGDESAPGNIFYLPSDFDPIQAARTYVNTNCESFATCLGVESAELQRTLQAIAYVDHHDFLGTLLQAQRLEARSVQDARMALMSAWLSSPNVVESASSFVKATLTTRVNSIP